MANGLRIAGWVFTTAGFLLAFGFIGLAIRDLIRPVNPGRHASHRNFYGPLKLVIAAFGFAMVRSIIYIIALVGQVRFNEMHYLLDFFYTLVRILALASILTATRRLLAYSSPNSKDSESGESTKPKAGGRWLDCLVIAVMTVLGFAFWGYDLGTWLSLYQGGRPSFVYRDEVIHALKGLCVASDSWGVLTAIYISFRLLYKRRQGGASTESSIDKQRTTFAIQTIPTMALVTIITLVVTTLRLFGYVYYGTTYEALFVLNLIAAMIGDVLLLEFSRRALRELEWQLAR